MIWWVDFKLNYFLPLHVLWLTGTSEKLDTQRYKSSSRVTLVPQIQTRLFISIIFKWEPDPEKLTDLVPSKYHKLLTLTVVLMMTHIYRRKCGIYSFRTDIVHPLIFSLIRWTTVYNFKVNCLYVTYRWYTVCRKFVLPMCLLGLHPGRTLWGLTCLTWIQVYRHYVQPDTPTDSSSFSFLKRYPSETFRNCSYTRNRLGISYSLFFLVFFHHKTRLLSVTRSSSSRLLGSFDLSQDLYTVPSLLSRLLPFLQSWLMLTRPYWTMCT